MNISEFLFLNVEEIRHRVLLEVRRYEHQGRPCDRSEDRVACQIIFLIWTYVSFAKTFGIGPYPDMLPHLGWPGQVIHVLFCQTAGMWEAFCTLVEHHSDLPRQTSRIEGDVVLQSVPERFVYRALLSVSGVTQVQPHPVIPGDAGRHRADFQATAATGRSVYIEVALVPSSPAGVERQFLANYRDRLDSKMILYKTTGIDPIVIWGDEVASPRMLAERLNDVRSRLGLPTRAPEPLAWYEEVT